MIDLKEVLELHAKFLSGGAGGVPANLENVNLRGTGLTYADLTGANLRSADLRDANLRWADLNRANLIGANLIGANLRNTNLTGAYLTGADLRGANLRDANLIGANLRGVNLRNTNLTGAYLTGAHLTGADLSYADLKGANLEGAYLKGTKFTEYQVTYIQGQALSKFEKNSRGNYIAYKTFGFYENGDIPKGWVLEQRRIIEEPNIECSNLIDCGPGVNVNTWTTVNEVRTFYIRFFNDTSLFKNPTFRDVSILIEAKGFICYVVTSTVLLKFR